MKIRETRFPCATPSAAEGGDADFMPDFFFLHNTIYIPTI